MGLENKKGGPMKVRFMGFLYRSGSHIIYQEIYPNRESGPMFGSRTSEHCLSNFFHYFSRGKNLLETSSPQQSIYFNWIGALFYFFCS